MLEVYFLLGNRYGYAALFFSESVAVGPRLASGAVQRRERRLAGAVGRFGRWVGA